MDKRGQVTIFIILGIVVVIAVVFGIALRKDIAGLVKGAETKEEMAFQEQANEVKAHVVDCLEKALKDAVFNSNVGSSPSITSYDDYYALIAVLVEDKTEKCINLNQFRPLIIRREPEMEVSVYGDAKVPPTKIAAEANFKLNLESGEDKASFESFTAMLPLKGGVYSE